MQFTQADGKEPSNIVNHWIREVFRNLFLLKERRLNISTSPDYFLLEFLPYCSHWKVHCQYNLYAHDATQKSLIYRKYNFYRLNYKCEYCAILLRLKDRLSLYVSIYWPNIWSVNHQNRISSRRTDINLLTKL